jgi:hypothetical protein
VIWTNLNAQSVCTYQIWDFWILWCSTSWEESKDYKFAIFGHLIQKIWINHANREFDSNLKIVSNWTHKIWSFIVLLDSTLPKDSNSTSFANFGPTDQKIWFSKDWDQIWLENLFEICLIRGWPRGVFWLGGTGSGGSSLWTVGSKVDWALQI